MGEMCRILVWGGFWCLLWSGTASGQFTSSPQTRPGLGAQTWFHGWYTRITSHNGEDVVGILTASLFDLDPQDCLDHTGGYVAIMRRNRVTGRLDVYESFPPSTRVVLGNALAGKQAEKVGYHWEADGIGFANEDEVHIQLHDGISFTACFHNRQAWDPKHPRRGPEGLAEYLALLQAHWSVYSVASETSFRLADSTGEFIGKGVAHQETNWGQAFPKAFVWAQGCSPDGQASFVLAGGKLPLGAGNLQGWLAGLRTPDVAWDFRPQVPGTVFSTQI
ncbi:MAG: hypothetical protein KDA80_23430, partial [Planctomycetaceae bacterium]|nr:hypothetical protein [Planctomycetaceae bacterium]